MKKLLLVFTFLSALIGSRAGAQIVLDDFTTGTQTGEGSAVAGGSWVGQVTQNATTITVAGTAHDDNGWGVTNLVSVLDLSLMNTVRITAQLDAGNTATSFNIQFFDTGLGGQAFSISSSAFVTGVMTTVNIPVTWLSGIDPTQINGWTIGGGNSITTGPDFRMTIDQVALTTSAVPEPSTYAAIVGALALGLGVWRRRATQG